MKERELKPCPFCGSDNVVLYSFDPYDGYMGNNTLHCCKCTKCGANIKNPIVGVVIDAWNRRKADKDQILITLSLFLRMVENICAHEEHLDYQKIKDGIIRQIEMEGE